MTDHVPTQDDVAAVFAFAGLTVSPERVTENYETYAATLTQSCMLGNFECSRRRRSTRAILGSSDHRKLL